MLLNFACEIICPLLKYIECYKRPLVTGLCHKKMLICYRDFKEGRERVDDWQVHLGLRRVKSRLMLKFLNFFEKERRVQACEAMLSDHQGVYKQIITGD